MVYMVGKGISFVLNNHHMEIKINQANKQF